MSRPKKNDPATVILRVRQTEAESRRLHDLSESTGLSMSDIVRLALNNAYASYKDRNIPSGVEFFDAKTGRPLEKEEVWRYIEEHPEIAGNFNAYGHYEHSLKPNCDGYSYR